MLNSKSEQGFSLMGVLGLALLATIAATAALQMFQHESKSLVSTLRRDRLEACLDSGLDKAIFQLNESGGWTNLTGTAYFNSLTASATAFTDIDGHQYWVKVLLGRRVQPTGTTYTTTVTGSKLNDSVAEALTNTGDTTHHRTVLIRARDNKSGVTMTAMAILHRSAISPIIPVGGIYTNGSLNNGGWPGSSYNSCTGISRTGQVAGCSGTVQSGGTISTSGAFCMPQVTVGPTPQPYPAVAMPLTWTVERWPFHGATLATINTAYSGVGGAPVTYNYNVTRTMKVQVGGVTMGNKSFNIVTNGFQVDVYVTGGLDVAGNGFWTTRGPNPGGQPANMWFYVVGTGAVTLSGTGTYECVIVAPQSTVTVNGGGTGSFSGAIVANQFDKNGSAGNFYFDECILQKYKANTYARPPIVSVSWVQF